MHGATSLAESSNIMRSKRGDGATEQGGHEGGHKAYHMGDLEVELVVPSGRSAEVAHHLSELVLVFDGVMLVVIAESAKVDHCTSTTRTHARIQQVELKERVRLLERCGTAPLLLAFPFRVLSLEEGLARTGEAAARAGSEAAAGVVVAVSASCQTSGE